MVDWDCQLANQRQAGVLEQIVDIINGAGTGVLNRHHGVIRLAGFYLIENISKLRTAALNELFEMAGCVLARSQVGVRAFWTEERDACRVRVGFVQMLLEQRLLGQNGIFDDELEQTGDVVGIKMMRFAELNQPFQ